MTIKLTALRQKYVLASLAVFALIVALSAITVWFLSTNSRQEIEKLAFANTDSTQWSLAQIEVEFLSFETAVLKGLNNADADLSDVRTGFDIFYARIQTIKDSASFEDVSRIPEVGSAIDDFDFFLDRYLATIDGDERVLRAALPALSREFDSLRYKSRTVSLAGVTVFASRSDTQKDAVAGALSDLGLIAFLLLAIILAVVAILLLNIRSASRKSDEIARTQSRLQAIISTSLDGILVVDYDGRIIGYNGAAERIFGYSIGEAMGQDMGELIVPDHLRDAHNAGMARYRKNGSKHVVGTGLLKLEARRKNGEIFPVEMSINAAKRDEGEIFVSYIRDISQRAADEHELTETRDKAVAGEKAKANLLAIMSHEMRTPLNGVLGMLQLLSATDLNERQRKYLSVMDRSGKMLLEHVNDVLDISRYDAGRIVVNSVDFDLWALCKDVVESLEVSAEHRGNVLLVSKLEQPIGWVTGDSVRLKQILLNLLGNAIKFTQGGQITLELSPQDNSYEIEFRIIDTGIGIEDDALGMIFEDFITLDASYQREVEGTGLGLGIVRRLVDLLGGEIGVESVVGDGSIFWFNIPLPRAEHATQVAKPRAIDAQFDAGIKILVVEDNEINRLVVREMLEALGVEVCEARDGHEGVAMASAESFSLILMDISMPKLDGTAATKMIHNSPGPNSKTPIVALTAHAMEHDISRFRDAGMVDVLTKPLSAKHLEAIVVEYTRVREAFPSPEQGAQLQELIEALGNDRALKILEKAKVELHQGAAKLSDIMAKGGERKDIAELAHWLAGTAAVVGFIGVHSDLIALESIAYSGSRNELNIALAKFLESEADI